MAALEDATVRADPHTLTGSAGRGGPRRPHGNINATLMSFA